MTPTSSLFAGEAQALIQTNQVVSLPRSTPLREAARIMSDKNIGCVVITENERPIGIFTERDLLRKVVSNWVDPDREPVETHMTPNPVCVAPDTAIGEVVAKMTGGNFRHLLVVNKSGRVTGVISVKDLLNHLVKAAAKV